MASILNCRRITLAFILIALLITAAAATSSTYLMWITLAVPVALWLIMDFMFADSSQFDFDTDYKNWSRKQRS